MAGKRIGCSAGSDDRPGREARGLATPWTADRRLGTLVPASGAGRARRGGTSMTDAEWLACEDPEALLVFLCEPGASDRKARLFGCACVRRVWGDLADLRLQRAAEVAERFADGLATARQLR